MTAYYNEIDPYAAQWLRNLIAAGHIAPGIVDERSIEDVTPYDLKEFTQCHFFAGIGVWSHALRRAGWADDRSVWTGSCPCQPFSAAGKGAGFADERHLWPAFNHLIRECRPAIVIGEQVASKDSEPWLDLVQADVEALGYAFGAVPFPSASIGAPHIRDRLYWVADAECSGVRGGEHGTHGAAQGALRGKVRQQRVWSDVGAVRNAESERLADANSVALQWGGDSSQRLGVGGKRNGYGGETCGLADTDSNGRREGQRDGQATRHGHSVTATCGDDRHNTTGPTNGFWGAADWLLCRDGKWRPVEPGTFPLAHGAPSRVGRLRAYGNAINAEAARIFIESLM